MELSIAIAFAAGVVSVISPCVLPLIPAYLSYIAGASLKDASQKRGRIFLHSVFFVLGFASVFSLLGVLLQTFLQSVANEAQTWLARAGGVLIMFFGLYLMGFFRIPFLEQERRVRMVGKTSWYSTSFLFGVAFAAGWTPCIGIVLASIISLAAIEPGSAFALFFAYSLGLGVPFLLIGFFLSRASYVIQKYTKAFQALRIIFGIILVALGILVFTRELELAANFPILNYFLLP